MIGHPEDWLIVADRLKALSEPKKIIDYQILCRRSRKDLYQDILGDLKEGWLLWGTPYGLVIDETDFHFQAMIKYGNDL